MAIAACRYVCASGRLFKWSLATGFAPSVTTRGLASSPSPALHQQQTSPSEPSQSVETARPYSEIPKTKTTFGLNLELMRDPTKFADVLTRVASELGHIFRIVGVPGMPPMVCVLDPKDVEAVYRVGDSDYPERLRFESWEKAREELGIPFPMFLA